MRDSDGYGNDALILQNTVHLFMETNIHKFQSTQNCKQLGTQRGEGTACPYREMLNLPMDIKMKYIYTNMNESKKQG